MNGKAINGAAANLAVLLASTVPVGEATSEQLQDRIKSTVRVQNQAAAIRAQAVAELQRREGTAVTETVLREDGLLPRGKAQPTGAHPTGAGPPPNKENETQAM